MKETIEQKLMNVCKNFIIAQDINCVEDIYQSDRVIENAYEFIEEVCKVVGYVEIDE